VSNSEEYIPPSQCTATGFYCRKKDVGLGIPKPKTITVSSSLKISFKFLQSSHPGMQTIVGVSKLERMKATAKGVHIKWPINRMQDIDRYKVWKKRKELGQWAELQSQGKAVMAFNEDKIANAWLLNPKIFKPTTFITALKMTGNIATEKVATVRIKIKSYTKCCVMFRQKPKVLSWGTAPT
jgi:hypothetical protein